MHLLSILSLSDSSNNMVRGMNEFAQYKSGVLSVWMRVKQCACTSVIVSASASACACLLCMLCKLNANATIHEN